MDFLTLNRRELQALCKLNKIPANITNIAMVDALNSLQTVEGIEEFLNPSRTETVGLSIESPERIEITSPRVPRISSRTCTRKKAKIELNEALKTPLLSCTRKKDPETSSFHDVANQLECEDIAKNKSLVNHVNCIPNTPVVGATYSQMKVTKSTHKETMKKETTTTVQTAYNTRRSTRLVAKKSQGVSVTSEVDVIVLDESDEDSKIAHVDTTFESGKEKVDCCEELDNLKVKLVEVFEQLEEKGSQVDNLKSDLEDICNPIEPSKLDNHNVVEIEGIEEFFNPSSSETAERIDVCARKKAKIVVDVASQLIECEDIAKNENLVIKLTPQDTVRKENTSEPLKIVNDFGNSIQEKHDDVVLDENSEIEKVVNVVMNEVNNNLKPDSEVDFVSMDFEAEGSLMEEIGIEISHESSSVADVSFVEEENHEFSTNANDDVSEREVADVVNMDEKSLINKNSLRQLKKKLKATLLNTPPPTSIRIKTEDSDNKDIEKPQVVVVEENEKEAVESLNKNNNTCSLRKLKKQLKAMSVKYNNNDEKVTTTTEMDK